MPILEPKQALDSLKRMFLSLPFPTGNTNPNDALRLYLEQCQGYSNADIDLAVKQFLSGTVQGVNAGFAPTTAQFAQRLRENLNYRASHVQSQNRLLEQFKEQELDEEWQGRRTPEAKAKIKAMVEAFAEKTAPKKTPEEIAAAREMMRKTDAYFADDFVDTGTGVPVSRSLAKQFGYETFDSAEEDAHDMGGMK